MHEMGQKEGEEEILECWSIGDWSAGMLAFVSQPSLQHSISPLLQSLQPLTTLAIADAPFRFGAFVLCAIHALVTGLVEAVERVFQIDLALAERSPAIVFAAAEPVFEVRVQRVRRQHFVESIARGDVMAEPAEIHGVEVCSNPSAVEFP